MSFGEKPQQTQVIRDPIDRIKSTLVVRWVPFSAESCFVACRGLTPSFVGLAPAGNAWNMRALGKVYAVIITPRVQFCRVPGWVLGC